MLTRRQRETLIMVCVCLFGLALWCGAIGGAVYIAVKVFTG